MERSPQPSATSRGFLLSDDIAWTTSFLSDALSIVAARPVCQIHGTGTATGYNRQRAQRTIFRASCQFRGSPFVLVMVPKAVLVGVRLGVAKLAWLRALWASARKRSFRRSRSGKCLVMEKSQLRWSSPRLPAKRGGKARQL